MIRNGRPMANGKPCASAGEGVFYEEQARREANSRSDDLYLAAQRRYELNLADKIETEICRGLPPKAHAERVIAELTPRERREAMLTRFERQMLAVKNGASIREEPPMPKPQSLYTLGGVSEI